MRQRALIVIGATVASLGSPSVLPLSGLPLSGLPWSSSGMPQAQAQPDKPCDNSNDGEEIVDQDGLWECDGEAGEWGIIDPMR